MRSRYKDSNRIKGTIKKVRPEGANCRKEKKKQKTKTKPEPLSNGFIGTEEFYSSEKENEMCKIM